MAIRGYKKQMRHNYRRYKEVQYSVPVADVTLIVFVVLKLTGVIDWSWWLVLSPIWVVLGLLVCIFAGSFIYVCIRKMHRKWKMRKFKT